MSPFKFELDQQAQIKVSGEIGQIIGRAEYTTGENSYYLRYQSADGRAVEAWWAESALADVNLACVTCAGTGRYREPYSTAAAPCPDCAAARPNSTASATTDASVNPGNA